ncbi:MAG: glycosyltransferase [Myxococcales bacterium]|nr:glycosyltransferase [Myxococcales bacterium]
MTEQRPLLSLAMIVKNEEHFLADALRSAAPFCDELVVVDTGSTDATVAIARSFGARVEHFAWCDDFSAARNASLRACRGQYILVLDADERLEGGDPALLRLALRPGPQHPFEAWLLEVNNTSVDGTPISQFFSVRIFPNDPRLGYEGRVHNRFASLDPRVPTISASRVTGTKIIHLGYDAEVYRARKKSERSLPLLEASAREHPDDPTWLFYLGREYLLLGRLEDARLALELSVEKLLELKTSGALGGGFLGDATAELLYVYEAMDLPPERSVAVSSEVLAHAGQNADLWFVTGLRLHELGAPADAIVALKQAIDLCAKGVGTESSKLRAHLFKAHEALGHAYWAAAQYKESYAAFLIALRSKTSASEGWPPLLNCLLALAIELGDAERLPDLRERLLSRAEAPLDMFFFDVDRRVVKVPDQARALMRDAGARHPRVKSDPEYARLAARLGLPSPFTSSITPLPEPSARPIRFLIGTKNIAGYVENLSAGLRLRGHHVESVLTDDNKFYGSFRPDHQLAELLEGSSIDVQPDGRLSSQLSADLERFLDGFDVFVCVASHSFLPGNLDFERWARRGKRLVSWVCGSEARHHSAAGPIWQSFGSPLPPAARDAGLRSTSKDMAGVVLPNGRPDLYRDTFANKLHSLRQAERYAQTLFGAPELMGLGLRPYQCIPAPLDLKRFEYRVPGREIPVVLHAPSNRSFKQTELLLAALDELASQGLKFELRLLEGVPHEQVREALADADIVLDQMSTYPALLAHEAMASGCAVLTGNLSAAMPLPAFKPALHIDPATLNSQLRRVLTDRSLRSELAVSGRAYVERFADHERVAQGVLDAMTASEEGRFDLYPTFAFDALRVPAGEVVPPYLQRLGYEVISRSGAPLGADLSRLVREGLLPKEASLSAVPRWDVPLRCLGPNVWSRSDLWDSASDGENR